MGRNHSISSHRGVVRLALLALVLVIGGAIALLGFAWQAVNHQEAVRETVVVRRMLERALGRVQNETASSTAFDETYKRTRGAFDLDWLDKNLADYLRISFGHDLTLVLDGQGRLGYASHDGTRADPASQAALARAVGPLVRRVQTLEMRRRLGIDPPGPPVIGNVAWTSAVVQAEGGVYLLGVSTIAPSNGVARGPRPAAVVVSGQRVDQAFLGNLDADAAVRGARLLPDSSDGLGVVTLPGSRAAVAWQVGRPGAEVLGAASLPIALAAALLGLTLAGLGYGIRQLLGRIEAHDTALQASLADLVVARDEAQAASLAKSQFVANISHEIRTPLNGVLGMAQVLERDAQSEAQRERARTIVRSGNALLSVLNDVLDMAKVEAGKLEITAAAFDLAELVGGACESFRDTAAAKGVALDWRVEAAAAGAWMGDAARIRQILLNLVSNAVKFTPAGAVQVVADLAGRAVRIAVTDQAGGIAADKLPHLFEKFSQLDGSATRRFGGTGLGLAISRELAGLMGGDILVDSEEGRGSTFTLFLPLEATTAPCDAPTHAAPAARGPDHRTMRVLAAEDNQTNQMVLRAMLEPLEVELVLANNGVEALRAVTDTPFDLILMDIQMPVMDGLEAAREIRALEARQQRPQTPIVALTANAMRHQVESYHAAGMTGSIAKPIQIERLFEIIAAASISGEDCRRRELDRVSDGLI